GPSAVNDVAALRAELAELRALVTVRAARRKGNGAAAAKDTTALIRVSGARQRSGGVEKYSSIASRQAPEHGSTASSPGPGSRISAAVFSAQLMQTPAEHSAARAVATRLVRCQSEALAHHASTDWKWCACAPFPLWLERHGSMRTPGLSRPCGSTAFFAARN